MTHFDDQAAKPMERQEIIQSLEDEFGLGGHYIYLLDIIPLVEVMWADGKNQPEEINLIKSFLIQRVADLSNEIEGMDALTTAQLNDFLDRFVHHQPPQPLLDALHDLACAEIHNQSPGPERRERMDKIVDYCLNIAAAAVEYYPYPRGGRITADEKEKLLSLVRDLKLFPEASSPV